MAIFNSYVSSPEGKFYSKMWNLYVEIFVSGIQNKKLATCIQTWQHQAETIFTNAN